MKINKASGTKTVLLRKETTVSSPVLKDAKWYYEIKGLSSQIVWARLSVKDLMIKVLSDYAIIYDGLTDQAAKTWAMKIFCEEGVDGLVKKSAEISDFLHLECLLLEQYQSECIVN